MQQIVKSNNLSADLQRVLNTLQYDRLFILADENSYIHCRHLLNNSAGTGEAVEIVVPPDDINKTLENLSRVWRELTIRGATRHSLLINLGGGMVTDLGGFAAATFKRGIKYINIPTTLLGAVDAAVGGKTGINFEGYKNEIGAFYPAEYVIISSNFFKTLDRSDLLSGYAEMIKHALINSADDWEEILTFSFESIDYVQLNQLLYRSVVIKQKIVEEDPYEFGIRKALNLGHTTAHAFESFALSSKRAVPHGFAVAWGIIVELYLSYKTSDFPKERLKKTVDFIRQNYGILDLSTDNYETLHQIAKHDKKNRGETINFTLLSDIGDVLIDQQVEKSLFFEALDFYRG